MLRCLGWLRGRSAGSVAVTATERTIRGIGAMEGVREGIRAAQSLRTNAII